MFNQICPSIKVNHVTLLVSGIEYVFIAPDFLSQKAALNDTAKLRHWRDKDCSLSTTQMLWVPSIGICHRRSPCNSKNI